MNSTAHSPPRSANSRSASQLVTANYEALRYTAPHNNSLTNFLYYPVPPTSIFYETFIASVLHVQSNSSHKPYVIF